VETDLAQLAYGGLDRKTGRLITKALPGHGNRVWSVSTIPVVEPVTLGVLKEFGRLADVTDEDSLLEGFIMAARVATEEYLGRSLISRTIDMKMDYWPSMVIKLPQPPLISVTKVATLDEDDTETEYDSDNYYVITEGTPGKLVLKKSVTAPSNTVRDYGGYLIRYVAGYGPDPPDVPAPIRDAIKLWAATIQATRVLDSKNPPPEARPLLDLFRTVDVMVR